MSRLIKFDLKRLFISKSFWFVVVVGFAITVIGSIIDRFAVTEVFEDLSGGMVINTDESIISNNGVNAFVENMSSNIFVLLPIFSSIFICYEFAGKTWRNIVTKGYTRIQCYLSKLLTMIVGTTILVLTMSLTGGILNSLLWEFSSADFHLGVFIEIIIVKMLGIYALVSLTVFVSMFLKNLAASLATNLLLLVFVSDLIRTLIKVLFGSKPYVTDFFVTSLLKNISAANYSNGDSVKYLLASSLIYISLTTTLGILSFRKTEL